MGNNINGKCGKQDDARSCQEECQKTGKCKFWTFNKRTEWCDLKTMIRKADVQNGRKEFISGDENCKVPKRLASYEDSDESDDSCESDESR